MKKIFLALVFLPTIAFGAPQSTTQIPGSTPPSPTGNPHACGVEWYPPAALAAGEEGKTTLSFRIGIDGGTEEISIATSSGFEDLDLAAIQCASAWKYLPATQNGKPRNVDWKAAVEWSMAAKTPAETVTVTRGSTPPSEAPPAQQPIGSQVCKNPMMPAAPLGKSTVVSFRIMPDGGVKNIKLYRSSGDDNLDGLALTCASQWRYTPLPGDEGHEATVMVAPVPW